ncbi:Vacuolar iron transporter 1-like protein [Gossypium australe]|uniref:Vacuolar iron transporter n=1 Tax=Gossypium australe TaxID=47621 RepID=A0A5B6VKF9_9ROSI|nr:Vacuolar iron transporter 1-like protein [Gossypium australe]
MRESDDITVGANSSTPLLEESEVKDKKEVSGMEQWGGEIVKSIVYAGLEAVFTCFSLISSISATNLSSVEVLALGIANLVADGISSSLGDFLSSSTKEDLAIKEMAVTQWELNNHRKDQQEQLLQQYQSLGMDLNDANTVVNIFAKYNDILRDQKMTAQKGVMPPDQGGEKPWKNGVVAFLAFVGFGAAPLLSFVVLKPFTDNELVMFIGACFMSAIALTFLAIAKAKICGKRNYVRSVGFVLLNGAVAASAAFFLGWML